jgi:hypothetical protein
VGRASLTRGRVYLFYTLLALASAVFLGSESLGTRDHIYCLRFETSFFVASYDSQGHGGGIRPRLHTGLTNRSYNRSSLHKLRTDHTENTSHLNATQIVYWRADCCLATSYKLRLLRHSFHCCALEHIYRAVA